MLRRLLPILGRCLRLRCPRCGQGRLFARVFTLFEHCPVCSLSFEPEQGYYVGAIYLNYAATVLIATPGFFGPGSLDGLVVDTPNASLECLRDQFSHPVFSSLKKPMAEPGLSFDPISQGRRVVKRARDMHVNSI